MALSSMCGKASSLTEDCFGRFEKEEQSSSVVIIFDWDDTLLPTTYLTHVQGFQCPDQRPLPADIRECLDRVDDEAVSTLANARHYGKLVVVTNADKDWVEVSSKQFLPKVASFITACNVPVISAKYSYESIVPDSPTEWKIMAFEAEILKAVSPSFNLQTVVVLGDNNCERLAGYAVHDKRPVFKLKTVLFMKKPNPSLLAKQLRLVSKLMSSLCFDDRTYDINLAI
eukprot:Plantae.Rhodophyta-Purpureofilum_apyrenoidigerum.ctg22025.p1 GENE.Plantae.Rhodophyta-Purpureofilum_apyrenoidigerum.ctg22025~~Plantae.Rhodophyta-Purpureofilum_apyrenoidigerum.ctg22025.p1  ORF type:complete len:228 (-),score=38.97 Plantae.Rhodophyta-Purpureofilum_apyrenoidigerum.ctg22025:192-875(-)